MTPRDALKQIHTEMDRLKLSYSTVGDDLCVIVTYVSDAMGQRYELETMDALGQVDLQDVPKFLAELARISAESDYADKIEELRLALDDADYAPESLGYDVYLSAGA